MNREILFRGKRVDNGEWVEGYCVKLDNKAYITRIERLQSGEEVLLYVEVIPETVGQYSGLDTDKDITEIYKDDIVKFDDGNICFTGRVDKECGAWGIVADNIPLDYKNACHNDNFISFWEIMWNAGNSDLILDDAVPYVRVIGNIHDNPELLEVAE